MKNLDHTSTIFEQQFATDFEMTNDTNNPKKQTYSRKTNRCILQSKMSTDEAENSMILIDVVYAMVYIPVKNICTVEEALSQEKDILPKSYAKIATEVEEHKKNNKCENESPQD